MITNPTDIKDLLAFIGALSQQESPLPDEIQQQIEEATRDLETNSKTSIDNLINIADKFEPLGKLYQEAQQGLTNTKTTRTKVMRVMSLTLEKQRSPDLENAEVENVSLSKSVLSVDGAKELKAKVTTQAIQTSDKNSSDQPWWHWLTYLFATI